MVRRYPRPWPAIADAARVALLVAVPLCVIALVFRSSGDEYGRGWAGEMAAELSGDDRLVIGASAAGAFFLGLLHVFVVLALVVVCRPRAGGPARPADRGRVAARPGARPGHDGRPCCRWPA